MVSSIAAALARIKDDPDAVLSRATIEDACRAHVPGGAWRDTPLAPPRTLALLIRQVAHGNCSCAELARLAGGGFTAAGYCEARMRLPLAAVEACGRRAYDAAAARDPGGGRWRGGHRVWLVDGSGLSMPDAPALRKEFGQSGQQKPGCGFPVAHVLGLFDLHTGLVARLTVSPMRTHDVRHAAGLHPAMAAGDVLLGDDAFGTYAHLALLLQADLHGLFPVHHKRIVDFAPGRPHTTAEGKDAAAGVTRARWVRSLGADDQVVEWFKPKDRPPWVTADAYAALPASIAVRETRRTVKLDDGRRVTVTTVCTLLDAAAYPAAAVVGLRQRRWQVEVDLRHLKTTMRMDVLRCRTVAGVNKEVAAFLLVYNLVRAIACAAARRQRVDPARVSFADALYWARHARAGEDLPRLRVNPHRPWRVEPRATKRRPKSYKLLNQPRDQLRQVLLAKAVEA
jgi:hypothetical protein